MAIVEIPYFGPFNTASVEEYYETEIQHNYMSVQIDINFENNTIGEERLIALKKFLEKIPVWASQNKQYIQDNLADEHDDTVREYAEFILEEFEEATLQELIDMDTDMEERVGQLTSLLHLVRIGLYPDGDGQFAVFDYTIGPDLLDNLIVINTDENGKLDYITMES
ncbi:MAG: DUF2004 domain-containing protein [Chitinophagaceae bacterium]|nr:DUF2004 domain-containing protein [Chitinophagaceae bacterium]